MAYYIGDVWELESCSCSNYVIEKGYFSFIYLNEVNIELNTPWVTHPEERASRTIGCEICLGWVPGIQQSLCSQFTFTV